MKSGRNLKIVNGCLVAALVVAFFHQVGLRYELEQQRFMVQYLRSRPTATDLGSVHELSYRENSVLLREVQRLRAENAVLRGQLKRERTGSTHLVPVVGAPDSAPGVASSPEQQFLENRPTQPRLLSAPQLPPILTARGKRFLQSAASASV